MFNGWSGGWEIAPSAPINSGNAYAIANYYEGNTNHPASPGYPNDQWLITPQISIDSGYHLKFCLMTLYSYKEDSLDILISNSSNSISDFQSNLMTFCSTNMNSKEWNQYDIDLSAYAGQNIYIAFREHISNNYTKGSLFALGLVSVVAYTDTDIAVNSIDLPPIIAPGKIYPKAIIKNLGYLKQTFTVTMTINPGGYSSTKTIDTLAGDSIKELIFDQFIAVPDTYQISITANVSNDINISNNTIAKSIICWGNPVLFSSIFVKIKDAAIVSMKFGGLSEGSNLINCADDFVVPYDTTWNITSIYTNGSSDGNANIDRFGIIFYNDNAGKPDTTVNKTSVIYAKEGTNLDTTQTLAFSTPVILTSGKYWLSVYAEYDTATTPYASCSWYWDCSPALIGDSAMLSNTLSLYGGTLNWTSLTELGLTDAQSFYFTINGTYSTASIDINTLKNIKIYPTPVKDILNIENAENSNLFIYNLLGETILNTSCNTKNKTIDLSRLSEGTYIVKVISDKEIFSKKINILK